MEQLHSRNRREYFRLSFAELTATMHILEVGNRPINTPSKSVRVLDVGGGGLSIAMEDDLNIRRGIVAQFEITVGQHSFSFRGSLVRKVDDLRSFQYGVKFFDVEERQQGLLVSILGRIQVERNNKSGERVGV